MNLIKKAIIGFSLSLAIFLPNNITFGASIEGLNSIKTNVEISERNQNIGKTAQSTGFKIINWFRIIFSAILVLFIVYSGIQMILSQGTDDDSLSKAKRSIWYAIIGMIFVNFPVEIYESIYYKEGNILFFNSNNFSRLLSNILTAVELLIGGIAIMTLVYEGVKVIAKSKDEEAIKNAKNKIRRVVTALIFLGFIELWKSFLTTGDVKELSSIFQYLANLVLYIAGPVAIFFLCLAGYYYIFSNGDEDKAKKGKNIIINTSIGIILVLCIYILLADISLLNF